MYKFIKTYVLIVLLLVALPNQFLVANAASFNKKISEIQKEITRDNVKEATRLLKEIKVSSEIEQERVNLLFGDIYLKINKPQKAEEFYEKSFFASNDNIEALSLIGLAEVRLIQGKLKDAISYAEQSIAINSDKIRPKIILAIAKTRIGEGEEGIKILNDLYVNRLNAEVALAISDYYSAFDDSKQAIKVLEDFLLRIPNHIKILDQLASLYLFDGDQKKALEAKFKVFSYHEFNQNKKKSKEAKLWILSVNPEFFKKDEKSKSWIDKWKDYKETEIENYEENKIEPYYENFDFAANAWGSGFIVGKGNYVITNYHVIANAKKIAVRNGIGKVSNAKVAGISKKFDLAILELSKPYPKKFSIEPEKFENPKTGDDVITIGYPGIGESFQLPTITEGIISKVFTDEDKYPGTFMTTIPINSGNSGGPIFNLKGNLVGVAYASIDKLKISEQSGALPSDMGYAIQSNMIKKVFKYEKRKVAKAARYEKASLYEKMLPSVTLVVVLVDE